MKRLMAFIFILTVTAGCVSFSGPAAVTTTAPATLAPTFTLTPSPTPTPEVSPTATLIPISLGNLHMHTTCSDGQNSYEEMVQAALKLGFHFVAVTDHAFGDYGACHRDGDCNRDLCRAVIAQCQAETRLVCIPGMEVTSKLHLLAVGITEGIDETLPLYQQISAIHKQGGLAIAAHPLLDRYRYSNDQLYQSGLDAMECGRGDPQDVALQIENSKIYRIPCVYGSDAHQAADLDRAYLTCQANINSLGDLANALKEGQCSGQIYRPID
jgi:predicted metal-dependent phosphoesterase TrpH